MFCWGGISSFNNILPSAVEAGVEIQAVTTRDIEGSKAALVRFGSKGTAYDNIDEMLENE